VSNGVAPRFIEPMQAAPVRVAQNEFTEWTPDGHLRHSSFAALRDDTEAREVGQR